MNRFILLAFATLPSLCLSAEPERTGKPQYLASSESNLRLDFAELSIAPASGRGFLVQGLREAILVAYDSKSDTLLSFDLVMQLLFSGGNIVGPLIDSGTSPNVTYSDYFLSVFEIHEWDNYFGGDPTSPDTAFLRAGDAWPSPGVWTGKHTLVSLEVRPTDTGTLRIVDLPPGVYTSFAKIGGEEIMTVWNSPAIPVVHCDSTSAPWGDALLDGAVNASDVIFLINHVFKTGPSSVIVELGDTNCSGTATAADIIVLVNYVFKSGQQTCSPCGPD